MRPRGDLAIAPLYLLILLASTALILPVATTLVRSDVDPIPGVLLWAAGGLLVYYVGTRTERAPRILPLVVAVVLNVFLMFAVAASVQVWALENQGVQFRATVTEVYGKHSGEPDYTLAVDGEPVQGRLTGWPAGSTGEIGDEVLVVQDPKGLIDPRLPTDLAEDIATDFKILILPLIAIMAVLCLAAVTPFPRRRRSGSNITPYGSRLRDDL